ncbi:MAG: DUF975 family protein [Clostridia bacterium]|nr:DUF975 family protein [Clostridia bacterium]
MNGTYRENKPKKTLTELRARGLSSLRGKWVLAILAMLIATMLGAELATTGGVSFSLNIGGRTDDEENDFFAWFDENDQDGVGIIGGENVWIGDVALPSPEELEGWRDTLIESLPDLLTVGTVFFITLAIGLVTTLAYRVFLGVPMRIGHLRFRLQLLDGDKASLTTLFSCFGSGYLRAVGLRIVRALYLFLWSLPSLLLMAIGTGSLVMTFLGETLMLGGIEIKTPTLLVGILAMAFATAFSILPAIATYRYAMSDYILAENPDMPIGEALRESARMMHGNKWRLLCLELSFIGWGFLCLFTCGLGFIWLAPYMYQAEAAFYHEISGREAIHEAVADMKELMVGL